MTLAKSLALAAVCVLALAPTAYPASSQIKILCEAGMKVCHGTCIRKDRTCLRCPQGTWYCNGKCISFGLGCVTPLSRRR